MIEEFDLRGDEEHQSDKEIDRVLRPKLLDDFAGQKNVVNNLKVFIDAAKLREETLDHVLFHGPPGLGKTTLSNIIANELGVGFKVTSGPVLDKPGDLAGLLTNLEEGDVLFIDEIHRLSPVIEEYLYSAMEDYKIDILNRFWSKCKNSSDCSKSIYLNWCNNSFWNAYISIKSAFWYFK